MQTKLVKNNQASNFATMLQKLGGLEAPVPELEMFEPEPEKFCQSASSICSTKLVTNQWHWLESTHAASQVLERFDRLKVFLNATWIKIRFVQVKNKTVSFEKSFNASWDENSQLDRKTANAMDCLGEEL